MSNKSGAVKQAKEPTSSKVENTGDKNEDLQKKVLGNVPDITDKVQQKADSAKDLIDGGAEKAGAAVQKAVDKAGELQKRAAEKIVDTKEYVKNIDLREAKESIESTAKENPGVLLLTIGILGLAVGYMIGKRTV